MDDAWARCGLKPCVRSYRSQSIAAKIMMDHLRSVGQDRGAIAVGDDDLTDE